MESFSQAEVEQPIQIPKPVNNERKNIILGSLIILGVLGVIILVTNKNDKKPKVKIIRKTKTIYKTKKGAIENEQEDEQEDDNDNNDTNNGNDDSYNGNDDTNE